MESKYSGMAIASLVCGIVGVLISWIPVVGWILPILAIVFGFVSINKIKKESLNGKTLAIIGIILGFLGLIVPLLQIIGIAAYFQILRPTYLSP